MSLKSKFLLTLTALAFLLIAQQTDGRPQPQAEANVANDVLSKLDSIFKVGPGMKVFSTRPSSVHPNEVTDEDDDGADIICAERTAGQSYCTEVPNYLASSQLDKIDPQQFEQFSSYFKDDFMQPLNVTNRMNEEAEENFCNSKRRIIYPKSVETKESKWVLVVQHERHRQGVLVEQCENEGSSCKYEDLMPFGVSSKCKQHYVYRSLIVLVNGVLVERMVKLPNYCECVLRFNLKRKY
ncbi:protein spaetzle-like [Bactrocera neohumeralis]|uniref:protein spaetzle-like n=1 Tax=Bactrocera neohumeralis TaxID=98809 RepID=UPI00216669C2|nr:protein spaetzle-like [Bactrocera neohumeralis]